MPASNPVFLERFQFLADTGSQSVWPPAPAGCLRQRGVVKITR